MFLKQGYNKVKNRGVNFKMLRVLLIFYVVWLTSVVSGKKRPPDRNRACMNNVNHLKQQMEKCHGMYFCGYFPGYGAHCIPNKEVCDGRSQCEGGEDEAYCPPKSLKCHLNEMLCHDGKKCAIPCNGIPECFAGIDELNCDIKCKSGEVQCSDGKCAVVGDGNKECEDGSDEDCPDCPACDPFVQCDATKGEVSCIHRTSGQRECVSTCDATVDCAAREDEKHLITCPAIVCTLNTIQCTLKSSRQPGCAVVCDGIQQCQDFNEEFGTLDLCMEVADSEVCPQSGAIIDCFLKDATTVCCGCLISLSETLTVYVTLICDVTRQ